MTKVNKFLKNKVYLFLLLFLFLFNLTGCSKSSNGNKTVITPVDTVKSTTPVKTDVAFWLTKSDQSVLFQKQNIALLFKNVVNTNSTIIVDTTVSYQTIDGFGFALTGGSAYLINRLPSATCDALLKELFTADSNNINLSYLRISIGASDLNASVFSYDDIPAGQTDTPLAYFNLTPDSYDLIPLLKRLSHLIRVLKFWLAPGLHPHG